MLTVQDDGTFGDDGDSPALAPSPGSVSLGTDSSEDEDDEDGDAGEHRMNVRTGQLPPPITFKCTWPAQLPPSHHIKHLTTCSYHLIPSQLALFVAAAVATHYGDTILL